MQLSAQDLEAKLDELTLRCRERGVPVTPQRVAIYKALLQADSHPDAEALYEQVRAQIPNLSLATVYKNLEALSRLGVVRELTPLHETARFDANLDRHHHLVCTGCKKVVDLYDHDLDALQVPPTLTRGFQVSNIRVQVEGLCADCARAR